MGGRPRGSTAVDAGVCSGCGSFSSSTGIASSTGDLAVSVGLVVSDAFFVVAAFFCTGFLVTDFLRSVVLFLAITFFFVGGFLVFDGADFGAVLGSVIGSVVISFGFSCTSVFGGSFAGAAAACFGLGSSVKLSKDASSSKSNVAFFAGGFCVSGCDFWTFSALIADVESESNVKESSSLILNKASFFLVGTEAGGGSFASDFAGALLTAGFSGAFVSSFGATAGFGVDFGFGSSIKLSKESSSNRRLSFFCCGFGFTSGSICAFFTGAGFDEPNRESPSSSLTLNKASFFFAEGTAIAALGSDFVESSVGLSLVCCFELVTVLPNKSSSSVKRGSASASWRFQYRETSFYTFGSTFSACLIASYFFCNVGGFFMPPA